MLRKLLFLFCILVLVDGISAQVQSMSQYIEEIEDGSDYLFNFDIECTDTLYSAFDFNEQYDIENIMAFFKSSPLDVQLMDSQLIVLPLSKKEFTICGSVKSTLDQSNLPYAIIKLGDSRGFQSGADGGMSYTTTAYKNELVTIQYLGFLSKEFMIQDLVDCKDVFLEINEQLLTSEIVIKDYLISSITEGVMYGAFNLDLSRNRYRNEVIENDVMKIIQLLPGIYSPDDSAVNLNIRGSSMDQNLINWEGVPLYDSGHLFGMVAAVNPFHLKSVNVYRSVHDAAFENRIGGVIDFRLDDRADDRYEFSVGSNLTEAHFNASLPLVKDKLKLIFSGRKSIFNEPEYSPTLLSYTEKIFQGALVVVEEELVEEEESREHEEQTLSLNYHDLNVKLIYEASPKLKFQSSFLQSMDVYDFTAVYKEDNIERADSLSKTISAWANKLSYKHNNQSSTSLIVNYSGYQSQAREQEIYADQGSDFNLDESENSVQDFQTKLQHFQQLGIHEMSIGYIYDVKKVESELRIFSDFQIDNEVEFIAQGKYHHLFIDDHIALNKWHAQLGLRSSYSIFQKQLSLSPRMALRYNLSPAVKLKTSTGIFHQYVRQIYETDSDRVFSNVIWNLDDAVDASLLKSYKYSLGGIVKHEDWIFDVEGYFHFTTGLSAQNPNIKNDFILNDMGELKAMGLDVVVSRQIGILQSSINYSLSEQVVYFPFEGEEEEREDFYANTDQRHVLNFVNTIEYKKLLLSASYQYRTGLPFTKPLSASLIEDDEPEEYYEVLTEGLNKDRLKDYHRLDLGIKYLYTSKKFNAEAGVSVLNLLNRRNLLSRSYSLADTDTSTTVPEVLVTEKSQLDRTLLFNIRFFF